MESVAHGKVGSLRRRSSSGVGVPESPSSVLYSTAMYRTGSIILS